MRIVTISQSVSVSHYGLVASVKSARSTIRLYIGPASYRFELEKRCLRHLRRVTTLKRNFSYPKKLKYSQFVSSQTQEDLMRNRIRYPVWHPLTNTAWPTKTSLKVPKKHRQGCRICGTDFYQPTIDTGR